MQSLFKKHSSLSWKKCWVHSSARATIINQALSKGKIHHPTTRIEITDLQLWFATVFTVCCPKYYTAPFYINFKKWTLKKDKMSAVLDNIMENITEGFWNIYTWQVRVTAMIHWNLRDEPSLTKMRSYVILSSSSAMLNLAENMSCSQICHLPMFLHLEDKAWLSL